MGAFAARYVGTCSEGDPIEVGDTVLYVADELTHVDCPANERREPAPCASCFLVHRGECF